MTREEEIDLAWRIHNSPPARVRTRWLRNKLAEQQNHRCPYCGVRMTDADLNADAAPSFEHVLPLALGGRDEISNLVVACQRCNMARSQEMWPEHKEALSNAND